MARGTVLIVENEEQLRINLSEMVRHAGFDVLPTTSSEEAMAALSTMHVDIVLADLVLLRLGDYNLLHWMQRQHLAQPVLVFNNQATPEDGIEALRIGAADHITNPRARREVEIALNHAAEDIAHRRTNAELQQRNRELATLNALAAALNSSVELDEMLDHALEAIVESLDLTGAVIYLDDAASRDTLHLYRSYGMSPLLSQLLRTLPKPGDSGIALGITQIAQLLACSEQSIQHADETFHAAIPMCEQGKLCGVLILAGIKAHPIRHTQLALMHSISNSMGVAIAHARVYSELRNSALVLERAVTERTRELQRSRDLLHTIFDGIPSGLLLIDADERVLAVNRAYAAILDTPPDTLINQSYSQIWSAAWTGDVASLAQRCIAEGDALYSRSHLERQAFSPVVLDHYLIPVRNATGHITQIIEYLEDVTDRLALERALTQHEQIAALGKLAATVAHEINTPLMAIRGCLGLTATTTEATQRTEYLSLAESELDRAASIIRVMLAFYQPTGNKPRAIAVNQLIEQVVQLLQAEFAKHNINIDLCLADELPSIVVINDQFKQVILNLILNAIEALPDGGQITLRTSLGLAHNYRSTLQPIQGDQTLHPERPLAFRASPSPKKQRAVGKTRQSGKLRRKSQDSTTSVVVIEIEDTGAGIPAPLQDKLFDAFVTTKRDRSGLGLAISRATVHDQGGTIRGENVPNGGARFTVAFPAPDQIF